MAKNRTSPQGQGTVVSSQGRNQLILDHFQKALQKALPSDQSALALRVWISDNYPEIFERVQNAVKNNPYSIPGAQRELEAYAKEIAARVPRASFSQVQASLVQPASPKPQTQEEKLRTQWPDHPGVKLLDRINDVFDMLGPAPRGGSK